LFSKWILLAACFLMLNIFPGRRHAQGSKNTASNVDTTMSSEDAQRDIATLLQSSALDGVLPTQQVRVDQHSVSYSVRQANGGNRGGAFDTMKYLSDAKPEATQAGKRACVILPEIRNDLLCWKEEAEAKEFVAAMNRMIWENSPEVRVQSQARERALLQEVKAWRAAGSKVEVPEEAQRHFVLAQQAFEEKNFQHQAQELSTALQVYPTWPAEQFDLAVLLGELNRYSEAIQHMQMYLALAPDAPDAQRAKQQIWIWQDKLQSAQQSSPPPAPTRKAPR
jgi:tetratricopeptide (TPR) repeat protein